MENATTLDGNNSTDFSKHHFFVTDTAINVFGVLGNTAVIALFVLRHVTVGRFMLLLLLFSQLLFNINCIATNMTRMTEMHRDNTTQLITEILSRVGLFIAIMLRNVWMAWIAGIRCAVVLFPLSNGLKLSRRSHTVAFAITCSFTAVTAVWREVTDQLEHRNKTSEIVGFTAQAAAPVLLVALFSLCLVCTIRRQEPLIVHRCAHHIRMQQQRSRLQLCVLALAVTFTVFEMPSVAFIMADTLVISPEVHHRPPMHVLITCITESLMSVDCSINFLLIISMDREVRLSIRRLFRCSVPASSTHTHANCTEI